MITFDRSVCSPAAGNTGDLQEIAHVVSVYRRIRVIYTWEELSERHAGGISTGQR